MTYELRLYEDTPYADEQFSLPADSPRALYVSAGSINVNNESKTEDEGLVSTTALNIRAGNEGATIWRWEIESVDNPSGPISIRSNLRLAGAIDLGSIGEEFLMRLDSVEFPPEGCALLHTHQGPGIRCLREGSIRIDTLGQSSSYCPGGAWFENGSDHVFAQADLEKTSRFIRAMVLPQALLGTSSIKYVNENDKHKPKSQSYRVFSETAINLVERNN